MHYFSQGKNIYICMFVQFSTSSALFEIQKLNLLSKQYVLFYSNTFTFMWFGTKWVKLNENHLIINVFLCVCSVCRFWCDDIHCYSLRFMLFLSFPTWHDSWFYIKVVLTSKTDIQKCEKFITVQILTLSMNSISTSSRLRTQPRGRCVHLKILSIVF